MNRVRSSIDRRKQSAKYLSFPGQKTTCLWPDLNNKSKQRCLLYITDWQQCDAMKIHGFIIFELIIIL